MWFTDSPPQRRRLIPETVQTSAMDCGPAALKSLLAGFDIHVSYGRLREACQTDVDGTAIETLEALANQLGLEAQEVMLPADHVLLPAAGILPAIAVIRQADGMTHFVVIWRIHGHFVQIMDPAIGRRWLSKQQLREMLYLHEQAFAVEDWYQWASDEGFCDALRQRLAALEISPARSEQFIHNALAQNHWQPLARLDAATRLTDTLVQGGGLQGGSEAEGVLTRLVAQDTALPPAFWSAGLADEDRLRVKGAVLVQVFGRRATPEEDEDVPRPCDPLAALTATERSPEQTLWQLLKQDGFLIPAVVLVALVLAVFGVTIEALLLKGLLDIGREAELMRERIDALTGLLAFFIVMLALEIPVVAAVIRMGRRLETRLRVAFLEKIPRLGDRYFHSRLTSDMAERAYDIRLIRTLPEVAANFLRQVFTLMLTTAGIIWLSPASALLAVPAACAAIGMALVSQPLLREQDLRFRTHDAALSRFYLDALRGLIPLRTHSAARALRREQESLLVHWFRTGMDRARVSVAMTGFEILVNTALAVWILTDYVARQSEAAGVLVLLYWILRLPVLGSEIANLARQYPGLRNRVLRLLEPLHAPEESETRYAEPPSSPLPRQGGAAGVAIEFAAVSVHAGGHTILSEISLRIDAGEHLAVVGPSGAGKSSLVGLLLGWYHPAAGTVKVDGNLLHGETLNLLRRQTAWVDPTVQIRNRSLHDNLRYGNRHVTDEALATVITQAELADLLTRLTDDTPLGEAGGLLSGGEGQRVRLGRAMLRADARLVILDEPFRGLDRTKRRLLLARVRRHWRDATLLLISHDVGDTRDFARVLTVEDGRVIEDAAPATLMARDSRYRALVEAETTVRRGLWESTAWRHLRLEEGELQEKV